MFFTEIFTAAETTTRKLVFIGGGFLFGLLFLFGLTMVPKKARKPLIALVTFIAGLYFSMEFLIPSKATAMRILEQGTGVDRMVSTVFGPVLRPLANADVEPMDNFLSPSVQVLVQAWQVIAGFTFALGIWNLVHIHGKNLLRTGKNWGFSLVFFLGLLVMSLAGFLSTYGKTSENPISAAVFQIITTGAFFQLDAAMFSLIAFFIISAAYRAFRIRSLEATIMMSAAFLVMLGQVPIGMWLTSWLPADGFFSNFRLEVISQWILRGPNAAAQRAINFGLAVGAIAMGLRIWLSLERGSYFDREV